MKRILDYFRGVCLLRIRGIEPERCLDALLGAGIAFWSVAKPDEFTLTLRLYRADARSACALAQRCQCDAQCTPLHSARGDFYGLKRRWVLLVGLPAVLALAVLLSNFVVAVDVQGCQNVEPIRVLRALEDLGVRFGAWGPSIDSEQIRNELLCVIPELRWAGVNWSGLRANVQVAERSQPVPPTARNGAQNLIACTDGVITQLAVYNGQAVCAPGDAVSAGQVLISGTVDLERLRVTTRALGEVYADTLRTVRVVTPQTRIERAPGRLAGVCVYVSIGRKRIKIFGSSGIIVDSCVKMIDRGTMRLPGSWELPIRLSVERYYRTAPSEVPLSQAAACDMLIPSADRQNAETMIAGQVLDADTELRTEGGAYCLTKTMHCREMIARSAEIPILELEQHGTNDQRGTDGTTH